MTLGAKVYSIHGEGSPIGSRETLRAAMLLELGYPLYVNEKGEMKCFQDITNERTGNRYFCLVFNGRGSALIDGNKVAVRDAGETIASEKPAEMLLVYRRIYRNFVPGLTPVKALALLDPPERLLEQYQALLRELNAIPRHVEVEKNGRRYFLTWDATAEQRAAEMAALDKRG